MAEGISTGLINYWAANGSQVKDFLKQGVAYKLLFGHYENREDLANLLAIAQVDVVPTLVMVLRAAGGAVQPGQDLPARQKMILRRLEAMLHQEQEALVTVMGRENILVTIAGTQDIALLLPVNGAIYGDDIRTVTHRYARYLQTYLERELGGVIIGIGPFCRDAGRLPQSFAAARQAADYCFYETNGTIVHSDDIGACQHQDNQTAFIRFEAALQDSLRRGDWDAFFRVSRELTAEIARGVVQPYVLKVRILELMTLLSRTVIDMGGDPVRLLAAKVRMGDELAAIATCRQLKVWLDDAFRDLSWFAQENERDYTARAIVKVKQYIHANYRSNITLEELARHALLSSSYLSHAFSETCRISITEYLKTIRVRKAQALLKSSDKTVTEVAASVGYADPNYFARVFKGTTGKSPQQYRKGE